MAARRGGKGGLAGGWDFTRGPSLAMGLALGYTQALSPKEPELGRNRQSSADPEAEFVDKKEPCVVQVAITCKHGQLNANQQEYITRKSEKLLTYFERVTAINVTVAFDNGRVRVEILVDAEHKHNFVANDQGDDVAPTFDLVLHKMENQIKKYKEKIQDHRRDLPLNELGPVE
jgi:putative sigma-54 modulation protein